MPTFLPSERRRPLAHQPFRHQFYVHEHQFYLQVQHYGSGEIGALEITAAKESATINGLLKGLSDTTSLGLQYGIPLESLIQEWKGSRFEPSGFTHNQFLPHAKSLADYVAQYLEHYQAVFPYAKTSNPLTRVMLPEQAVSITHKSCIEGHDVFFTYSFYPKESKDPAALGALKIGFAREGSEIYGILDTLCTTASTILQHGVPAKELLKEWKGLSFPPQGWVKDGSGNLLEVSSNSILDYAASYLLKVLELEK